MSLENCRMQSGWTLPKNFRNFISALLGAHGEVRLKSVQSESINRIV
jgi:hypothetical protein